VNLLRTPFGWAGRQEPTNPPDTAWYLREHEIGLFYRGVREGHTFLHAFGPNVWDREWVTVYE